MSNYCVITGRFTRNPEYTPANGNVNQFVKFTIASDNKTNGETSFYDCIAWGRTADNINKFFSKGRPIQVVGNMEQGSPYLDKEGKKRRSWETVVRSFEFIDSKPKDTTPAAIPETPLTDEDVPF